MADVTNELMFEVLKSVQARLGQVDGKVDEVKQVVLALGAHLIGIQQEIAGVHSTLVRHEQRLDRMERRLELSDTPTS